MKKRFLSILATLCLCLTLLPATAMAGSSTTVDVSTWADLQAAIDGNNDAILTSNITWGGSSLTVPTGKNVTLDLNGCKIDAQNQGTAIQVYQQQRRKSKRNAGYRTSWWCNHVRNRNQ